MLSFIDERRRSDALENNNNKRRARERVGGSTRSLTRSLARKRKRKRERFFNGESESFCVSASNVGKNTRQIFFGASVQKSA